MGWVPFGEDPPPDKALIVTVPLAGLPQTSRAPLTVAENGVPATAFGGADKVKAMIEAGLTVIMFDGVDKVPSVMVIVLRPVVLNENRSPAKELSLPTKLHREPEVYGRIAAGSVLVKYTEPL